MQNECKANNMWIAIITGVLIGIGVLAAVIGGPDNPVEEAIEEVTDDVIEEELHLPPETVHIDLSPGSKET